MGRRGAGPGWGMLAWNSGEVLERPSEGAWEQVLRKRTTSLNKTSERTHHGKPVRENNSSISFTCWVPKNTALTTVLGKLLQNPHRAHPDATGSAPQTPQKENTGLPQKFFVSKKFHFRKIKTISLNVVRNKLRISKCISPKELYKIIKKKTLDIQIRITVWLWSIMWKDHQNWRRNEQLVSSRKGRLRFWPCLRKSKSEIFSARSLIRDR